MRLAAALAATLLLLAAVAPRCVAVAPAPLKRGKVVGGPKDVVRAEDVKYISCQVCQLLAKNAWQQVKQLKKASTPANPTTEDNVIDLMEKITTAWRPEGEWIASLDLVEQGDKLVVKEMGQVGNCGSECKTVQLAAEHIMGEHDTDIAEILFVDRMNRAQFNRWLCWEASEACKKEPPPLPKDRTPGQPFDPRQAGDQSIDAMPGGLEAQGLSNNKKLREELMQKLGVAELEPMDEDDTSVEAALQRAMAQAAAGAEEDGSEL